MKNSAARLCVCAMVAVLLLTGAGCSVGPSYRRPEVVLPEAYRTTAAEGRSFADLPWWQIFRDPQLQTLVETALSANLDLRIAAWRVEEARARLRFASADRLPELDAVGTASRDRTSAGMIVGRRPQGLLDPAHPRYHFRFGADLSWELDLWGKYRRAVEAAGADLLAGVEARRAVIVTLVADVATLYVGLRELDSRLLVARRTLAARRESLVLVRKRFEGGAISRLDVHQAEVEETTAAAAAAEFERRIALAENALSILLGRPPGVIPRGGALDERFLPPELPTGLPSELLARRPDVRQAEEALRAQTARVGLAEALRLPSFTLSTLGGFESHYIDTLLEPDSKFWGIGGGVLAPLVDFGRRKSRVEEERALLEEAGLAYRAMVLRAIREVDDSLVSIRTLEEEYRARRQGVEAAGEAVRLARLRYDGGYTSYLEVLDAERALFAAELDASETLGLRLAAVVDLYRALGGGWDSSLAELP